MNREMHEEQDLATRGGRVSSAGCRLLLTLRGQWGHVLVTAAVDLVAVRVHGQHQNHDAAHDAAGHGSDWRALDRAEGGGLVICGGGDKCRCELYSSC